MQLQWTVCWIFDQRSCYRAYADNALKCTTNECVSWWCPPKDGGHSVGWTCTKNGRRYTQRVKDGPRGKRYQHSQHGHERVWGQAKSYSQQYTNYTLACLHNIMNPALDSVSTDFIRKYYRKVEDYERACIEGKKAGKEVEVLLKYTNLIEEYSMNLIKLLNLKWSFIWHFCLYSFVV